MELKQVTKQTCSVYRAVRNSGGYTTVNELARKTEAVPRTIRNILRRLVTEGVLEIQIVHGGFRYRVATSMPRESKEQADRIHEAEKIFYPRESV